MFAKKSGLSSWPMGDESESGTCIVPDFCSLIPRFAECPKRRYDDSTDVVPFCAVCANNVGWLCVM